MMRHDSIMVEHQLSIAIINRGKQKGIAYSLPPVLPSIEVVVVVIVDTAVVDVESRGVVVVNATALILGCEVFIKEGLDEWIFRKIDFPSPHPVFPSEVPEESRGVLEEMVRIGSDAPALAVVVERKEVISEQVSFVVLEISVAFVASSRNESMPKTGDASALLHV